MLYRVGQYCDIIVALWYSVPHWKEFLNQAHVGCRPADAWFLEIEFVHNLHKELKDKPVLSLKQYVF